MSTHQRLARLGQLAASVMLLFAAFSAFGAVPRTQIQSVTVDTAGDELIIRGVGFQFTGKPAMPHVRLGDGSSGPPNLALTVTSASPTMIVADLPATLDTGEFLLLVERLLPGKNPTLKTTSANIARYDLTIAAGGATGVEFGAFFGMTAGPGNLGSNDYAASIAVSGGPPSVAAGSAINFPRASAPAVGGVVINNPGAAQTDNTEFILPSVGTYRVTWHISVNEPAQLGLWISSDGAGNILPLPAPGGLFTQVTTALGAPSQVGRSTGPSQLVGDVIFFNPVAGSAIQIRNYASASALTATPLPGGTQAQAVTLTIQRLQ